MVRWFSVAIVSLALLQTPPSRAAQPVEIDMIASLTGPAAFIGKGQLQAVQAVEALANKSGGIGGRSVKFVVNDDQSSPQVAVQLARGFIAQHVPVILGPSTTASCNAVEPLVAADGPVVYCLSGGIRPPHGGYEFTALPATPDFLAAAMRYFRDRGWERLAYIITNDASGQDAEQGILAAAAAPGNRTLKIVDRENFAPADISVAAQVARIKAARPDALLVWVTGAAAGRVLLAAHDAGLDVPTLIHTASMTPSFWQQFRQLFPTGTYAAAIPLYAGDRVTDRATRAALATLAGAVRGTDIQPDLLFVNAWDPAMLVVDALKKLGPEVPAGKLRDYLLDLHGWVGANGPYDFRTIPQRGIGVSSIVITQWDPGGSDFVPVSRLGGTPVR